MKESSGRVFYKRALRGEMGQQNTQLQVMVNSLFTENMDLKRRIGSTEKKFSNIEKLIQNLKKGTSQV